MNTTSTFTIRCTSSLFESLNTNIPFNIVPMKKLEAWLVASMTHVNLFEAIFVSDNKAIMLQWLDNILRCLFCLVTNDINMNRATLWISIHNYETVQNIKLNNMVDKHITRD